MFRSILPSSAWRAFGLLVTAMALPLRAQPAGAIGAETRSVISPTDQYQHMLAYY